MKGYNLELFRLNISQPRLSTSKAWLTHLSRWMLSLLILLNGCAPLHLPEYKVEPFDQYKYFQVKDGLAVAIHPVTDKQEIKKYFGEDLLSINILPVFVFVENRRSSSSFILPKDKFSLKDVPDADGNLARNKVGSVSGAQSVAVVGVALILTPLALFVGAKMLMDADAIKHNLAVNELQSTTLSPGEETHGFVYFQLPEEYVASDQWTLHLEALDLSTKDSKNFNIPFKWEKE